MKKFFHCSCYYTHNIFVKTNKKHFIWLNERQFNNNYEETLHHLGSKEKELLLNEIKDEINRRKNLENDAMKRKAIILNLYHPISTDIFMLRDEMLEPKFLKLLELSKIATMDEILPFLDVISEDKQLYGFQMFQTWFCESFVMELEHYEQSTLPKGRPNTMNKYGVLLDELGIQKCFSDVLRKRYLEPVAKILFPEACGSELDSHKIFSVTYKVGQDVDLDLHYDNSEVTLNLCLGKNFSNGDLYFGDMNSILLKESTFLSVPHRIGYAIFHRGQQMHGALPLTQGTRTNLIVWLRSSSVRNSLCPMCQSAPNLVPSVEYGDGFARKENLTMNLCSVT